MSGPSIIFQNTNRRRDFTFATKDLDFVAKLGFDTTAFAAHGGSEKFMDFLANELQPFIAKNYKVNDSKTIIGESLGGLLATEILLKRAFLFNNYIIVSPSLWWNDQSLLKDLMHGKFLVKSNPQKIKVFVGVSNKAEDTMMYSVAQQLFLGLNKYPQLTTYYNYLPSEKHATILHQAVYNAFKLMYPLNNQ